MTKERPIIGITPCSRTVDYEESVRRAGGEPVVLSNDDDPTEVLERVDGILLTGGADVDPALYGQEMHPTTEVATDRDRFEVPLTRAALERAVPLFAICRGVQVLNVAAGGTLIQDLPSQTSTIIEHSLEKPSNAHAHDVRVTPGSRLGAIMGHCTALDVCSVNSRHHQAVDLVAPSFVVSAASPDGVVEAIERPDARFCVGVQWHPENYWASGEFLPLFEAFVEAAASRQPPAASGQLDKEDGLP